jgi:hypothetical protein
MASVEVIPAGKLRKCPRCGKEFSGGMYCPADGSPLEPAVAPEVTLTWCCYENDGWEFGDDALARQPIEVTGRQREAFKRFLSHDRQFEIQLRLTDTEIEIMGITKYAVSIDDL